MKGDERVRHCDLCDQKVFNIAEMTSDEAEDLLRSHAGRLCLRVYRRGDGTVLTRDCPVGLALVRRRLAYAICVVLALVFGTFSIAMAKLRGEDPGQIPLADRARQWPVIGPVLERLDPAPVAGGVSYTGKVAVPSHPITGISAGTGP